MHKDSLWLVVLGQFGFVIAVGGVLGAQPTTMVEATPPEVRCTAVALGYNLTLGLIGGVSPLVATWLVHRTGDNFSPAWLLMLASAVSFGSVLLYRETSREQLAYA
jgi:MHS family proline/betaine transporter-like MFS transporter